MNYRLNKTNETNTQIIKDNIIKKLNNVGSANNKKENNKINLLNFKFEKNVESIDDNEKESKIKKKRIVDIKKGDLGNSNNLKSNILSNNKIDIKKKLNQKIQQKILMKL